MASNEDFWEQYKHPLWQEKRLEVMNRAEFKCEECGCAEKQLNVHHSYYLRDHKPWEYPSEHLHCLCEECHNKMHEAMTTMKKSIGTLSLSEISQVASYSRSIEACKSDKIRFISVANGCELAGVEDAFKTYLVPSIYDFLTDGGADVEKLVQIRSKFYERINLLKKIIRSSIKTGQA